MRVVLLLSGGIDSAAAGKILVDQGAEVIGVTFDLGDNRCCALDLARRICNRLGITHYVYNLKERFEREIIQDYQDQLLKGFTPNPCPGCNIGIKFKTGMRIADEVGSQYFATGHYARRSKKRDFWQLIEAKDRDASQSYFLALIDQEILARILFPIGGLKREEVARIGERLKAEFLRSQEVCFDLRFEKMPGDIVDLEGKVLGRHDGHYFYTHGQRHGLGIGGGEPYYVVRKGVIENRIIVGRRNDLMSKSFQIGEIHWIGPEPDLPLRAEVRVRYQSEPISGVISKREDRYLVELERPHFAITPGQLAVFNQGEVVLGGGWIDAVD
ncbi:MAG TPA: tRNA 2-thiouridine(34) synthase MnmA [bacterium (Candidatus Stahlbacteria)]|nr:tRNA 2-thiouridine(34) synthase MnmA [Candidatus Stahlbacteria bacterium]